MKIERIYELEIQGCALRLSHDEAEQLFTSLDNVLNKNTIRYERLPGAIPPMNMNRAPNVKPTVGNTPPRAGIDYIDR